MKYCLAILMLFLFSCGNSETQQNTTNTEPAAAEADTLPAVFYKRYSGTIAGQPVVLYLHRSDRITHGTYFYEKVGRPITLDNWYDTSKAGQLTVLSEWSQTEHERNSPEWQVILKGRKISGTWQSADSSKSYPIELEENYPEGSNRFSRVFISDSIHARENRPEPSAHKSYQLLVPADSEAEDLKEFYNKVLGAELKCDVEGDYTACLKAQMKPYFDDYLAEMKELDSADLGWGANNHYESGHYNVVYNEKGWLVLQSFWDTYMGGAHGMHSSTYINMDMRDKKVWKLGDVLKADSVQLTPILDQAARGFFKIPATGTLEGHLFDEHVPPTDNFYILPGGLVFVYNPYEIASYADGEINLYVPYDKIIAFLTPEFKKRMGL